MRSYREHLESRVDCAYSAPHELRPTYGNSEWKNVIPQHHMGPLQ